MTSDNEKIIDGWVFSSNSGTLTTPLGQALKSSYNNKTGIKIWGSLEDNQNMFTFRTQSWSKYQQVNLDFNIQTPLHDFISIKDALTSVDVNSIRAFIIQIQPTTDYESQGIKRTSTFVLVADESGTAYLAITDLQHDTVQLEQTYDISKVRKKMFNGAAILSTTIDTSISLLNTNINPDLNDVDNTMNIDFTEKKTITTTILEVGQLQHSNTCITCSGNLLEVPNATALMICEKCKRHSLKRNTT